MQIEVDKFTVLITYKRIKNVYLRVLKDGKVSVSAPVGYPVRQIEALVLGKGQWIDSAIAAVRAKQAVTVEENAILPIFGKNYRLVREQPSREKGLGYISGEQIVVYAKSQAFKARAQRLLGEILLKEAQKCLSYYSSESGLSYGEVAVKRLTSKWGYCKIADKKIVFSLALIFKPYECLKYVAMHELAHTRIPNHGKQFYMLVEKYVPDYKQILKELKK